MLAEIGFVFENPKTGGANKVMFSAVWNKAYLELCDYRDEHGNIEVPENYKQTPESSSLMANWIRRQRSAFKAGRLDNDLIQKLEEVGVDLSGRSRPFGFEIDTVWSEKYKELKKYSVANSNCDVPEENTHLRAWVNAQREAYGDGKLSKQEIGMLESIGFDFFSKVSNSGHAKNDDDWDARYPELKAYFDTFGDTDVPRYYPLNMALGDFVNDLRTDYQHGQLTESRKKVLQKMNFTFVPNKGRQGVRKWDTFFDELKFYKAKYGTVYVPDDDKNHSELAGWISRQRRYFRDGTLHKERYKMLKKFGFDFGNPSQARKTWDAQYQALVDFKEENGHLKIPTNYEPNPSLYFWIGTQRQTFKNGKLSEERIEKLLELGIDLEVQQTRDRVKVKSGPSFLTSSGFDKCFSALVKYKEEHGDCNVSQREEKDRLGSFVHYMRFYYRQGKLSDERIKQLEDVGFSFNIIDTRWYDKYEELAAFSKEKGNCDVPLGHNLYAWCAYQRQAYKNGKLAEDRFDLLRQINFKLEVRQGRKSSLETATPTAAAKVDRNEYLLDLWEKSYKELVAYKEKYGNCKIPVNYTANPSLGAWAFAQRMAHKKEKLSEERVTKLTEIGLLEYKI